MKGKPVSGSFTFLNSFNKVEQMKYVQLLSIMLLVTFFLIGNLSYGQEKKPKITVLTNGHLIDGTGKPLIKNVTVVIEGNIIKEITKGTYTQPSGELKARVFDLEGGYLLPGLWNMHVHLSDLLPDVHGMLGRESTLPATIRAGRNAMDALRRGFTGLRIVGERDYIDIAWREAFNSGVFVGPRIYSAGKIVTPKGDYSSEPGWPVEIYADGPEEIRKAVLENIAKGIDLVKIFAPQLQEDEMNTIIELAHSQGLKVTAHSGGESAHRAVVAGVDCIEHGTMISDETIQLMAEKGTFLCPTVVCNLSKVY
jgi:imidazolonepropionase-like amidohydrolase